MSVGFVGECHSEQRGAEGMMTAFTERLASIGLSDIMVEKMVGLTTDGESANTGKKSGIWARMSQHLGHGLMTVWCVAHPSDLAFESIEATVSELRHWLADLRAVATYFRSSSMREEDLVIRARTVGKEWKVK